MAGREGGREGGRKGGGVTGKEGGRGREGEGERERERERAREKKRGRRWAGRECERVGAGARGEENSWGAASAADAAALSRPGERERGCPRQPGGVKDSEHLLVSKNQLQVFNCFNCLRGDAPPPPPLDPASAHSRRGADVASAAGAVAGPALYPSLSPSSSIAVFITSLGSPGRAGPLFNCAGPGAARREDRFLEPRENRSSTFSTSGRDPGRLPACAPDGRRATVQPARESRCLDRVRGESRPSVSASLGPG